MAIVSQNVSWPGAREVTTGWPSSHSRIVSHQPADETTLRPSSSSSFSSTTPRHAAVLDRQPLHAAAQLQLAAERAKLPHQVLEDQPHARLRPAEPFQKDAAEHDRELAPIHVVLAGRAVEHQRAEQHLDQQRLGDDRADDLAGRDGWRASR